MNDLAVPRPCCQIVWPDGQGSLAQPGPIADIVLKWHRPKYSAPKLSEAGRMTGVARAASRASAIRLSVIWRPLDVRHGPAGYRLEQSGLCHELGPLPAPGVFDRGAGGFSGIRARFMTQPIRPINAPIIQLPIIRAGVFPHPPPIAAPMRPREVPNRPNSTPITKQTQNIPHATALVVFGVDRWVIGLNASTLYR